MRSKNYFILIFITVFHSLISYSQDTDQIKIGVSTSGYYDSEHTLIFLPAISITYKLNTFEVAPSIPLLFDFKIKENYISDSYKYRIDDSKIGFYMSYKKLFPIIDKNYNFYWKLSLLNFQSIKESYGEYNSDEALYEYIKLHHQLMTGLGIELKLIKDLSFLIGFNFGLENIHDKTNIYTLPGKDSFPGYKDYFGNAGSEVMMTINLGLKYNFIKF